MRVLVFAHVPPPLHGQSYMVKLMLENVGKLGAGGGGQVEFLHVNARLSDGLDDIGSWRMGKFFRLLGYIFQVWWMRWKYSPDALYYVPAPPAKSGALYRDWMVLTLVAPLFKAAILHWHAAGLGQWVRENISKGSRFEAWMTRKLFQQHDLSCVLNEWGRRDVEVFFPKRVVVVPNGIPDPCPDFASSLLSVRIRRRQESSQDGSPAPFQLLYLAHATRSKGLFDAIDAVALANARLEQKHDERRIRLTVAGAFLTQEEELAFRERIRQDDLSLRLAGKDSCAIHYAGYADSQEKDRLLRESDALCFASYFPNEGQPVAVIEALAYGLPVLLSRWRSLPEMVPSALAHLAEPANSASIADALLPLMDESRFEDFRKCYVERYSLTAHCESLRAAFLSVRTPRAG